MREHTVHRIDGVGRQRTHSGRQFDPRIFEQAIHGLQETILRLTRYDVDQDESQTYTPNHVRTEDEDGVPILRLQGGTTLHDVCTQLTPKYWDLSVVTDRVHEHSYGVRASVDCGDDVIVRATIFVRDGTIRRFDVAHTAMHDTEEFEEVRSLSTLESARKTAHLNRWLERSVTAAYAKTIPSAATAFDFIATKEDIPALGPRRAERRTRRENLSQKEWASIREKTPQTVSDNVREARGQLRDPSDHLAFNGSEPALEQLTEEMEPREGDIRLV